MNNINNIVEKQETDPEKKNVRDCDRDNGFADWGGYMAAKRAKLMNQFEGSGIKRLSNIFEGVAIHVNGLTRPPIDELKNLMAAHGGLFHLYQVSSTTHIIASNLPNVKIKHLGTTPIVKPSWITESIDFGKLLDYRRYLLYNNQSKTQPKIDFPVIEKSTNIATLADIPNKIEKDDHISIVKSLTNQSKVEHQTESISNAEGHNKLDKLSIVSNQPAKSDHSEQINRFPTKTASDPNFLEEFYNNSRLHLISTLGAEFKHLVSQMRDTSNGKFPGIDKLLSLKGNYKLKATEKSSTNDEFDLEELSGKIVKRIIIEN